mgnify:CR=1 FL=1
MESEILKKLASLDSKLDTHSSASEARERRSEQRDRAVVAKVEALAGEVRKAQETADRAHAVALEAKHAAGAASISSEGNDHNLFAELGSLKVVLAEHTDKIGKVESAKKEQAKLDAKARKFWRVASPAIIALVLAILNRLTFMLAPPAPATAETPVKVVTVDAGK